MSEPNIKPVKVLFVCLGNICRSPTAEGIFRHMVRERGLEGRILHDSCGTGDWHTGEPPDARAQAEARRRGINIGDLRGRQVRKQDFAEFDYVLAMDDDNHGDLRRLCPPEYGARLHRAVAFAPETGATHVPDPYYGGEQGFARVYDLLSAVCDGLLRRIAEEHKVS